MDKDTKSEMNFPVDSKANWPEAHREFISTDLLLKDIYQRFTSPEHAKRIAAAFLPELYCYPLVGRRHDGRLFVIDGAHRIAALQMLGWSIVPVCVLQGTTRESEARMFAAWNGGATKKVEATDRFHADLIAGVEEAQKISDALADYGLSVPKKTGQHVTEGSVGAISTVIRIWRKQDGERRVRNAMRMMVDCWGKAARTFQAESIGGTDRFLALYGKEIDRARAVKRFSEDGLDHIFRRSRSARDITRTRSSSGGGYFAWALAESYNKNQRAGHRIDQGRAVSCD